MKNEIRSIDINKAVFCIFLIFILVFVATYFYFVPMAKEFKIVNIKAKYASMNHQALKNIFEARSKELDDLKQLNKEAIIKLSGLLNEETAKNTFSQAIGKIKVDIQDKESFNTYFSNTKISVKGSVGKPNDFLNMIKLLSSQKNMLEVSFPIKLNINKETKALDISFFVVLYQFKDLNSSFGILKLSKK